MNFFYVCQLASFLTDIRQIYGYIQFWMRYISDTLWIYSWGVGTLVLNNCEFYLCQLVCQLAFFFTENRPIQRYFQFWMSYLSEFCLTHYWDVCTPVPNHSEYILCLSVFQMADILAEIIHIEGYIQFWFLCRLVCQLAYFLTENRQIQGYLQFW